jgi:hypothetical protein
MIYCIIWELSLILINIMCLERERERDLSTSQVMWSRMTERLDGCYEVGAYHNASPGQQAYERSSD